MLSTIIGYLVPALMGWLAKEVQLLVSKSVAQKAASQAAMDSVQALSEAKTANEINKATDSTLSGF